MRERTNEKDDRSHHCALGAAGFRKGIRFSKSHLMHRIVAGLLVNYWFFDRNLPNHFL